MPRLPSSFGAADVIWLTHLRTIAMALTAFTFCCSLLTQMLARALGYASELGPALIDIGGFRLYAPFAFLGWTLAWAPVAPTLLVLALCLALVCALAAYAVAILVAQLEPLAFAAPSPWRDLACWREIGHYGLLRDEGLALGAVRRHAWAKHRTLRSDASAFVFLGAPLSTDDAVLAALASWPGTLVLVDARGRLTERLGRNAVVRFAPGRSDTLSINPLLALRGGLHAWDDARQLAASLLADTSGAALPNIDVFALFMLDQLVCAPLAARTLAGLRRRLIDPAALLASLCSRWAAHPRAEAAPANWEMVRVAKALRSEPDAALAAFARIDQALAAFADAGLAHATGAHQLNLADVVRAPTPQTLVLSMEIAAAASCVRALLTQLAAHHANASNACALLLAIEADAARLLAKQMGVPLAISANTKALIQTADIADAERLLGAGQSPAATVAIGPQSEASAQSFSHRAGQCRVLAPVPHASRRWRGLLFPAWVKHDIDRLPQQALQAALPSEAFYIASQQKPVRMRVLVGGGAASFVAPSEAVEHDWMAPPDDIAQRPEATEIDAASRIRAGPPATKLRRLLTRAAVKPANPETRTP